MNPYTMIYPEQELQPNGTLTELPVLSRPIFRVGGRGGPDPGRKSVL